MELDSKVIFAQRLSALGIEELLPFFAERGWDTFGHFAFAIPSPSPGTLDEAQFRAIVINKAFNIDRDTDPPPKAAALRRLWFEASVLAVNELKLRVERTDESAPRRIPLAELEARKDRLKARLSPGLIVEDDLDPGE